MSSSAPKIDEYKFGKIIIDGESYQKDVILLPDRILPGWWRREGHSLAIEDLHEILDPPPRILIIGSGAYDQMRVPEDTLKFLREKGIDVRVNPTAKAVEMYNRLREQGDLAAALHLTC